MNGMNEWNGIWNEWNVMEWNGMNGMNRIELI